MVERDVVARLETILASQMNRNELTCPGEHEYEPHCTHGNNHDPVVLGLRSAVADIRALLTRCEQAEQEREEFKREAMRLESLCVVHAREERALESRIDTLEAEQRAAALDEANNEVVRLKAENDQLHAERQRDALDGQAALDEANNAVVALMVEVGRLKGKPTEGDWWCPKCKTALSWSRVTFEERCDTCGTPVTVADIGLESRHEQDVDAAYMAGCETGREHFKADYLAALARFKASRKGGSE